MAIKTLNELSTITARQINTVRQDVKRGKLEKSGRGVFDDQNEINKAYILKYVPDYYDGNTSASKPLNLTPPKNKRGRKPKKDESLSDPILEDIEKVSKDLSELGEQELKEEFLRRRIIMSDQEEAYKRQQTLLSETKRKKMEGDLIEADWVVSTIGHGIKTYKKEVSATLETLVNTIISEQGIIGEDKTRYIEMLRKSLEKSSREYEKNLRKIVLDYSPEKINVTK